MDDFVNKIRETIEPLDKNIIRMAEKKWDAVAKPLKSLGELEEIISRLCAIQKTLSPKTDKKAVVIMCADNGVVAEGVTQTDSSVTKIVTENFARGIGAINAFSRVCGADVYPVDIGVSSDIEVEGVINRKIKYGTHNFAVEKAIDYDDVIKAIKVGIDMVGELKEKGYSLIAVGEMGIGNTTTSSAVLSALTGIDVCSATGKGAGLSDEGLKRKTEVIENALEKYKLDKNDVIGILSAVGGLDICGMCGCFIGGAIHGVGIVIDGFISAVSALCAVRITPECAEYIFASHKSREKAGAAALEAVGKTAYFDCGMCLGEGTGAVIGMKLFDFALAAFSEIVSFEDADIEQYEYL